MIVVSPHTTEIFFTAVGKRAWSSAAFGLGAPPWWCSAFGDAGAGASGGCALPAMTGPKLGLTIRFVSDEPSCRTAPTPHRLPRAECTIGCADPAPSRAAAI